MNYAALRVGETRIMNNGFMAKIIKYVNCNNIRVKFLNDNTIRDNIYYDNFVNGRVSHPLFSNNTSFPESVVNYYLSSYGYKKYNSGRLKDMGYSEFGKYEIDVFNIDKHIAFEIDGYWHKDKYSIDKDKNEIFNKCFKDGKIIRLRYNKIGFKVPGSKNYFINFDNEEEFSIALRYVFKKELGLNIDVNIKRDKEKILLYKNGI